MLIKKFSTSLLSITAALLAFIAIVEINFTIGWICFVPLFIAVSNTNAKQHFKQGFIFGFILSCFAYSWMISGAERFTGYNFLYGAAIFLVCALIIALYWACVLLCVSFIKIRLGKYAAMLNGVGVAALFCVFEYVKSLVAEGMPWFSFYAGNALEGNLFSVQPASFFGIYILSFVIVFINYLIAVFLVNKQWKKLFIPAVIVIIYICCGYFIYQNFNSNLQETNVIKIAIASENIRPDIKWDDANGNMLVQRLLDLNKAAVAQKPNIILWSESAVPWTYKKDDDLVNEILKESASKNITHILGINTEVERNIVNNSAYCILPNGAVANRYDKQFLLSFIEKPLSNMSIPFFSSKGFFVSADKTHSAPLQTPYGKAGIMICNESTVEASARNSVEQGAEFFCNMSNDGWFNDTYIINFHFLNARLRAVETRKDVVVNCNNGYSGVIDANGNIIKQQKDTDPFIIEAALHSNDYKSVAVNFPFFFISICAGFLIMIIALQFLYKNHSEVKKKF